jgi:DNA-binding GntR family transcriptional regulator
LVENIPYRGTFVRKLVEKDIQEIYQLRITLECLAMELALPKFQDDVNLQKLNTIHQKTLDALQGGDPNDISKCDLEFHRFIVELSENSRLIRSWETIVDQSRYLLRHLYASQIHLKASDHTEWLEAIRDKKDIAVIQQIIKNRMNITENILFEHWHMLQTIADSHKG